MILSWWCPLGHWKWHLPAKQFILAVRLTPILTHLSSRWTVPLRYQSNMLVSGAIFFCWISLLCCLHTVLGEGESLPYTESLTSIYTFYSSYTSLPVKINKILYNIKIKIKAIMRRKKLKIATIYFHCRKLGKTQLLIVDIFINMLLKFENVFEKSHIIIKIV